MPESGGSARDPHYDNWHAVLALMEKSIAEAAQSAEATRSTPWELPEDIGPLPEELRPRAYRILREQQDSIGSLESRVRETGRHIGALDSIPVMKAADGKSAYLDITT